MSYKRETLELKTDKELKRMCSQRLGIHGVSKKRKHEVIDIIMSKYGKAGKKKALKASKAPVEAPAKLEGVEGSFQSSLTKPGADFGFKTSTTVQVSCGANTGKFPVVGRTVAEVGEFMREVLNVDKLSTGLVNGKDVDGNYILKTGDVLEFLKPAGRKG